MYSALEIPCQWRPLEKAENQFNLRQTVDLIAKGLIENPLQERSMGLTEGLAGISIFFHYAADLLQNETYKDHGNKLLEEAISIVESTHQKYNFADGIAGFAWTLNHLASKGFIDIDVDDFLADIDGFMAGCVEHDLDDERKNLDFFWGATGVVHYLLSRSHIESNLSAIEGYLDFLQRNFMDLENDLHWSSGLINLTFAHGIPSFLSIVVGCVQRGLFPDKAKAILESGIDFILSTEIERENRTSMYSYVFYKDGEKRTSRMGWCQGDLMMGQLIWRAGELLQRDDYKEKGIEVLTHTTFRKEPAQTQIVDAGLCHGTAGLAHMYNRAYYLTQVPLFKETAIHWVKETLKFAEKENGSVYFKAMKGGEIVSIIKDEGYTMGTAGVGLALLAFIYPDAPDWDYSLLLS